MLESLLWNLEFADGRHHMASHLGLLARKTLSCPSRGVMADVWPDESAADGLACALDTRMAQSMNGVKDFSSP